MTLLPVQVSSVKPGEGATDKPAVPDPQKPKQPLPDFDDEGDGHLTIRHFDWDAEPEGKPNA